MSVCSSIPFIFIVGKKQHTIDTPAWILCGVCVCECSSSVYDIAKLAKDSR